METNKLADLGVIGLAPMGKALALNLREKGYTVAVFNRTAKKVKELEEECALDGKTSDTLKNEDDEAESRHDGNDKTTEKRKTSLVEKKDKEKTGEAEAKRTSEAELMRTGEDATSSLKKGSFIFTYNIEQFTKSLKNPKKIITIVKGTGTDEVISHLSPFLSRCDFILDFSNSTPDITEKRQKSAKCNFLGVGISGGTEGARNNGGVMVGGASQTYATVQEILHSISNSVGYFGEGGSGHFVKMVHNAIEYALMGVLAEFYELLVKIKRTEWIFKWNEEIRMYLIDALESVVKNERFKEIEGRVEMKGTGMWVLKEMAGRCRTVLLGSAIDQRIGSQEIEEKKDEKTEETKENTIITRSRTNLKRALKAVTFSLLNEKSAKNALLFCLKMCYREGIDMLENNGIYNINVKEAVRVWRKGCIIQSNIIDEAIDVKHLKDVKKIMLYAVNKDVRMGTISNCYYKKIKCEKQVMILAGMRDYFGAHGVYINNEQVNIEWEKIKRP